MKKITIAVLALLGTFAAHAQKEFEGKVEYQLKEKKETEKAVMTLWFSKGIIRADVGQISGGDANYVLINTDSGKIYNVMPTDKVYYSKPLYAMDVSKPFVPVKKEIAGQPVTSVQKGARAGNSTTLALISMSQSEFFISDSLRFTIPAKYANTQELMMIENNHIVLGAIFRMSGAMGEYGGGEESEITITAERVTPMAIPEEEMIVPADYEDGRNRMAAADTAMAAPYAVDTTSVAEPVKPKKSTRKPAKKSAPQKATGAKAAARKQ